MDDELRELTVEQIEEEEIGELPDRDLLSVVRPESLSLVPPFHDPSIHDPGLPGLDAGGELGPSSDTDLASAPLEPDEPPDLPPDRIR